MEKGEENKATIEPVMYVKTTSHHPVTCELDRCVFENYVELKNHVTKTFAMPIYTYVLLVHDRLGQEREKVVELEKRIVELEK